MLPLSRRDFLRSGMAVGAAISLPATSLLARSANESINLGFIVDVEAESFVGEHADAANSFLKREYRAPFVVPELVS
jgi:hypothetical protein